MRHIECKYHLRCCFISLVFSASYWHHLTCVLRMRIYRKPHHLVTLEKLTNNYITFLFLHASARYTTFHAQMWIVAFLEMLTSV